MKILLFGVYVHGEKYGIIFLKNSAPLRPFLNKTAKIWKQLCPAALLFISVPDP
jgi:hypothetical protein